MIHLPEDIRSLYKPHSSLGDSLVKQMKLSSLLFIDYAIFDQHW